MRSNSASEASTSAPVDEQALDREQQPRLQLVNATTVPIEIAWPP